MTTGFDDNADERAEIEWQSYQQDLAVEAAVKAERERVLAEVERELRLWFEGRGLYKHVDSMGGFDAADLVAFVAKNGAEFTP